MSPLIIASALLAGFAASYAAFRLIRLIIMRRARGARLLADCIERFPGIARNEVVVESGLRPLIELSLDVVEEARLTGRGVIWEELVRADRELSAAGVQTQWEPGVAVAYRMILAGITVALGVVLAIFVLFMGSMILASAALIISVPIAIWIFRSTLKDRILTRSEQIERELPYTLEFLSMMMRANATLEGAIEEYCANMPKNNAMASELRFSLRDLRYGLGVTTAFHNLRMRVRSDSIATFSIAVEHGVQQGQSMTRVLAEQAQSVRTARYQSAERIAKTAAGKGALPSLLSAFACFLLLLGPIILRLSSSRLF